MFSPAHSMQINTPIHYYPVIDGANVLLGFLPQAGRTIQLSKEGDTIQLQEYPKVCLAAVAVGDMMVLRVVETDRPLEDVAAFIPVAAVRRALDSVGLKVLLPASNPAARPLKKAKAKAKKKGK